MHSVAFLLRFLGYRCVIIDTGARVGHAWRNPWDSLRLFTPARWSSLPGMPFPAPRDYYPSKEEMAEYLETYPIQRYARPS